MAQPSRIWIVRHGESAGNVAWQTAEAAGSHYIDVSPRDADVPLSPLGERQAQALGRWFRERPHDCPTAVLTSPYHRALHTAQIVMDSGGLAGVPLFIDERLREKEFGVLNRMTRAGIAARFPDQAELKQTLGKFYFRPPGGESWCDIVLRLRSLWESLRLDHGGGRVLMVCHSVVTFCLRYIIEGLTERQVLDLDAVSDVANCALTTYGTAPGPDGRALLALEQFNFVAPMEEAGEKVTTAPDAPRPK